MPNKTLLDWWQRSRKWFWGPALLYLVIWIIYTYPTIRHFSTDFFADNGDGLQNVWNIWWVNKSLTQLHQLPYFTQFLHLPTGVTLLGQTMNPFNGFVSIALLHLMSLTQAHNTMYVFAFVMGGVTAFWLAYEFCQNYWLALIGGFLFTFSTFHTSHGMGHLQMTTLQWIPLFILLWWRLLKKPHPGLAVAAAFVLFLVQMSDLYYFFYSVLVAGISGLYVFAFVPQKGEWLQKRWVTLLIFVLVATGLTAPLMLALTHSNSIDPFIGSHDAITYSADVLSIFNPTPSLRIGILTQSIWPPFAYTNMEGYIYLGISVIVPFIAGLVFWKKLKGTQLGLWYILAFLFGILSLGPRLHFNGTLHDSVVLPYAVLEKIIPSLKLSGVPVRMIIVTTLAGAVIVPTLLAQLPAKWRLTPWIIGLLVVVMVGEFWPRPNYLTSNIYPPYTYALKNLPSGNVIDLSEENQNEVLYHQTLHEKPLAFGSISRTPQSVVAIDDSIQAFLNRHDYTALCSVKGFRYLVVPATNHVNLPTLYQDSQTVIYDLGNGKNCS